MEDLVETLTRGNVTEVKVVLASIAAAIVVITVTVALMCIAYFGVEHGYADEDSRATLHVVSAITLLVVLALKVVVVRWWHAMSRFLPVLGLSVLLLFAVTWATSAGDFLAG